MKNWTGCKYPGTEECKRCICLQDENGKDIFVCTNKDEKCSYHDESKVISVKVTVGRVKEPNK